MRLLRARLTVRGIAVVWIDEAYDLYCADRGLILRAIKSLMQRDEAVAIILSGIGKRRFSCRLSTRWWTALISPT